MILIVGGTGNLGVCVAHKLLSAGKSVRIMTRTPAKAEELRKLGAEVVQGNLLEPASLAKACQGADQVIAAAHGFKAEGRNNPQTVDRKGNHDLIDAAKAAKVKHFVFLSTLVADPQVLDFFRYKHQTEQYLQASGLSYTIVRATAFMEFWAGTMIGEPILKTNRTTIFGRGNNPVNFVAVEDVAQFTLFALQDPRAKNRTIEVGGPDNLSMNRVAEIFEKLSGKPAKINHVPLPLMKVMSVVLRPFNPAMARQIKGGILFDTTDMCFDMRETLKLYPISMTSLGDFIQKRYGSK
jgi:uncharacterized protein YbjT (DUF2867 family)